MLTARSGERVASERSHDDVLAWHHEPARPESARKSSSEEDAWKLVVGIGQFDNEPNLSRVRTHNGREPRASLSRCETIHEHGLEHTLDQLSILQPTNSLFAEASLAGQEHEPGDEREHA